jgi:hypothetical protein
MVEETLKPNCDCSAQFCSYLLIVEFCVCHKEEMESAESLGTGSARLYIVSLNKVIWNIVIVCFSV